MSDIPWGEPATLYSRLELQGGPPRERALMASANLRTVVIHAMRSSTDGKNMVIKMDDQSGEYAGGAIVRLFDRLPLI